MEMDKGRCHNETQPLFKYATRAREPLPCALQNNEA
jgi:hypothetical protein